MARSWAGFTHPEIRNVEAVCGIWVSQRHLWMLPYSKIWLHVFSMLTTSVVYWWEFLAAVSEPRGPGFDSRCYQISWEAVGLEQGPLSLVSIIEKLLERKSSSSGLDLPTKIGTNFTGRGILSVGIVRLRTKSQGVRLFVCNLCVDLRFGGTFHLNLQGWKTAEQETSLWRLNCAVF
jgi:hypothetical protein